MQTWRTLHPPKRGRWGRRPLVHTGFLKSWTRNGLNASALDRLFQILRTACSSDSCSQPPRSS